MVGGDRKSLPIGSGQGRLLGAVIPAAALAIFVACFTVLTRLDVVRPVPIPSLPLFSILNTLFMTLVSLVVAYVALRSFAATGLLNSLLLGSAMIPSGLGALIGWMALYGSGDVNAAVTSHNIGVFLFAAIHFSSAVLLTLRPYRLARTKNRALVAWSAYLLAAVVMGLVYLAGSRGFLPVFFTPQGGGTPLRQLVLTGTIVLCFVSGSLLIFNGKPGRIGFLLWYGMALFAMGTGLVPIAFVRTIGGILSWTGRSLQYLSGVYLLIAVWTTVRTARYRGVSLEKSIAGFFQESEVFLRELIDTLSDAVIAADESGRVVLWNEAAVSLFGYSRGAALGSPISRLFAPEEAEDGETVWRADGFGRVPVELTMRRKTGERFPAELTRSARNTAVGRIETLVIRDVSERRRHQILQLEQYQLLESVLGQAPDALVVYDVQGKLLFLNRAARELGFEDIPDSDWIDAFRPVWLTGRSREGGAGSPFQAADRFRAALSGCGPAVFEAQGRRDGRTVELLVSTSALRDQEGNTIGATAVLSDVSRLKRMEERLRNRARKLQQLNAELGEFTYISSHDLKEPLRTLTSYLQILSQDYRDHLDGDGVQMMEAALAQAGRMRRLIDDLLSYSRVGNGERSVGRTAVKPILDQVLLGFRGQLEETGGRVESGELPEVCVDPTELTQLLQNLISNGLKYRGSEAPCIRVGCEPVADGMVRISVEDNGIGIEQRHRERVFRAFQRLHSRSMYEGTGIGLAICKKVVEGYGGRIWVESEPGCGSTFYFTLPAGEPIQGEDDEQSAEEDPGAPDRRQPG